MITTRSSNGISVVKQQGDFFHLPSEAKEVFDVSGAGDTVLGYFASSISRGISLEISTQISNTAAGIAVGKFGTSVVDYKEINSHKNIKLSSLDSLIKTIKLHDKNKVIGFTNGCFDLLHAGHISYLKKAKELCDILILALNSDLSIKKLKGKNRPIVNEEDRIEILSCLPFLDQIIIFNELTPLNIIKKIKPNIIFKGKDYLKKQVVGFEESKSWGGKVKLIDFVANKSTTKIIERIKKMLLSAVFFDVDGTIAETEELHRMSFNESFKEFNLNWFWDKPIYKRLINIGGGKERIEHYIRRAWPEMLEYKNLNKYINSIHKVKSEIYEDYINESKVEFRPGVFRLMEELKKKCQNRACFIFF